MRRWPAGLCCIVLLVTMMSYVLGDIPAIKKRGYIRIALPENNIYGYVMQRKNGELYGIDISIAKLLASDLDVKVDFIRVKSHDFNSLAKAAHENKVDMAIGDISATWKRAQTIHFTIPYIRVPLMILTPTIYNQTVLHGKMEALNNPNIKLGVISHSIFVGFDHYMLPRVHQETFNTRGQLLKALEEKRVNAVILDQDILSEFYQRDPGGFITYSTIPLRHYTDPIAIAVRYGDPRLHGWLDLVLGTLVRNKIINQIYDNNFKKF